MSDATSVSKLNAHIPRYRALAETALRRAGRTYDAQLCTLLLRIGNGWNALADEIEEDLKEKRAIGVSHKRSEAWTPRKGACEPA